MMSVLWLILLGSVSWADSVFETKNAIPIGSGISSPSNTDALADNPAGLVYNSKIKFLGATFSEDKSFNPFGALGRLALGNSMLGGAIGLRSYTTDAGNRTAIDYGMGGFADAFQTAVGFSVTTSFEKPRISADSHQINLGLIYNPFQQIRVGALIVGALGGAEYYGLGTSYDFTEQLSASLDTSTNSDFQLTTIQPAIGYHLSDMQFSVGYGYAFKKHIPSYIRQRLTLGARIHIGQELAIQGQYQHQHKYLIGVVAFL